MTDKPKLEIEIDGWKLTLTFRFLNHYAAMKLFDEITSSARDGFITLDVEVANGRD